MSTLNVATIKSGSANTPPTIRDASDVEVGTFCRAWVNFNGTGVVATRATFNVSSISDNGTGDYTVNFTNAFADANYATCISAADSSGIFGIIRTLNAATTTAQRFLLTNTNATANDVNAVNVAIFR